MNLDFTKKEEVDINGLNSEDRNIIGIIFKGYASVFNVIDRDSDQMEQGVFTATLSKIKDIRSIKLLLEHNSSNPIGIITSVSQDSYGLYVEGEIIADSEEKQNIVKMLKNKTLSGLSVGYLARQQKTVNNIRHILDAELAEISLVALPSNLMAGVIDVKDIMQTQDMQNLPNYGFNQVDNRNTQTNIADIAQHNASLTQPIKSVQCKGKYKLAADTKQDSLKSANLPEIQNNNHQDSTVTGFTANSLEELLQKITSVSDSEFLQSVAEQCHGDVFGIIFLDIINISNRLVRILKTTILSKDQLQEGLV
ncbi:MAG: HK97 family phage prohead protease [Alphaproteobacteria bacterium]|nr:HK97 family phage prohead protease [Rickettsiales bacterium]